MSPRPEAYNRRTRERPALKRGSRGGPLCESRFSVLNALGGAGTLKICHCGAKFSFEKAELRPAPPGSPALRWWFCLRCNNFSHAHQEVQPVIRAPRKDTVGPLSSQGKVNGQWINTWATPEGKVQTVEVKPYARKVPMSSSDPIVYTVWQHLMTKVAVILAPTEGPGDNAIQAQRREQARYEARGVAETLAVLMNPFMETADDVVRHAVKKYKEPDHEVPGLAEHLWDPSKNYDGSERVKVASPRSKPVARPKAAPRPASQNVDNHSTKEPSPEEVDGIKFALDSGMFSKEQVCTTFGISMATLNRVMS
jgi:hypothetical protein